ncbi:ParB/RepB/Spo0J family partition protein, partial [Singulisphaera rosea]
NRYAGVPRIKGGLTLPVSRIIPDPEQPRKQFDEDELANLAASLKDLGQLMPILVRWSESADSWIIVSGERRWRASRIAGLETIDVVELGEGRAGEDMVRDMQIAENCVRQDLHPVDRAQAFKSYMTRRGWSARQLAEHLHLSPSTVLRAVAVLDLPEDLKDKVQTEEISPATAREIAKVEDPAARAVLVKAASEGTVSRATVRESIRSRPQQTKATYAVGDGIRVTIQIEKADAPHREIVEALMRALAMAEGDQSVAA